MSLRATCAGRMHRLARVRLASGFRHLAIAERGVAALEFALTAPVLILLLAGIVEFGALFQIYASVNRLATQYAIAYADCSDSPSGTCNTELSLYNPAPAIQNIVPQLHNTVTLRMFQVSMFGATPNVIYATPSGATLTAAETTAAQHALTSGQVGVVVTVSYAQAVGIFPTQMVPILGAILQPSYTVAQLKS